MSTHRISIDTTLVGQYIIDQVNGIADDPIAVKKLLTVIEGIASGEYQGKIRMNLNPVQAAGTITFASFADADTVTINGTVLTGKTTPSGASQWAIGATDEICSNNLLAKINASALAKIVGCAVASRRSTVALAGMVAGDTVTVNNVVFTCTVSPAGGDVRQFALGSTDAITAANLSTAINSAIPAYSSLAGVVATVSSVTVTLNLKGSLTVANSAHATVSSTIVVITSIIPGQIGNLGTLAISAHGTAVSPTGGTEGTEVIFARNNVSAL